MEKAAAGKQPECVNLRTESSLLGGRVLHTQLAVSLAVRRLEGVSVADARSVSRLCLKALRPLRGGRCPALTQDRCSLGFLAPTIREWQQEMKLGSPQRHFSTQGNGRDWFYSCVSGGCSAKIS